MNPALPYLHGGSHAITLSVLFKLKKKTQMAPKKRFPNMVYRFCIIKTFETLINITIFTQKKTFFKTNLKTLNPRMKDF